MKTEQNNISFQQIPINRNIHPTVPNNQILFPNRISRTKRPARSAGIWCFYFLPSPSKAKSSPSATQFLLESRASYTCPTFHTALKSAAHQSTKCKEIDNRFVFPNCHATHFRKIPPTQGIATWLIEKTFNQIYQILDFFFRAVLPHFILGK